MDSTQLTRAVADLAELERTGFLSDVKADVAAERQGWPKSDLKRFPLRAGYIAFIADEASQLFGAPYAECLAAAAESLLPTTRQKQALATIARYAKRLRGGR